MCTYSMQSLLLTPAPLKCRFILLEEEVSQVFGEDGLESQGFEALKCLKQFQCISSETIHYVIVSVKCWYVCLTTELNAMQ